MMEPATTANALTRDFKCPFAHGDKKNELKNELPPDQENDSAALATSLDGNDAREKRLEHHTTVALEGHGEQPVAHAAHHLLPGNESLKHTRLHRWIDASRRAVDGDIGYRVNDHHNGAWLVGNAALAGAWSAKRERFRRAYALAAMRSERRQFHDRHPAYSEWVIQVLNKIATKLEASNRKPRACPEPGCAGARKKPGPAFGVLPRLHALENRLHGLVVAPPRKWRKPVLTSRYALILLDETLSADAAREQLSGLRSAMASGRPLGG
ncbi:MAG: AHH domain-containing protein [Polyangiales bacterium]